MVKLVYKVWNYYDEGTSCDKRIMFGDNRKEIIKKVNESLWTDQTWSVVEWIGGDCD